MSTLYYHPRRGGKATKMSQPESPVVCLLCESEDVQSLGLRDHVVDMEAYFCNTCGKVFMRPLVPWADFKRARDIFYIVGLQLKVNALRRGKGA